jgi:H+/Na+-translocating ferredoxin:NAD+ oxidoreductase subunit C
MAALKPIPERLEGDKLTFSGGVHPPGNKHISEDQAIERAPIPPEVWLPLSMHVGAPAVLVVEKKAEVKRGQLVAEAAGFVSAPIHSPVTGIVKDIMALPHQSGRMVNTLIITTNVEETEAAIEAEQALKITADCDISGFEPAQIVEKVKGAGIVGLGGAAFPGFIKMLPNKDKPIEIVILNGTECEPFLTADHRTMVETPEPIIAGLRLVMRATGAARGAIGIEDNKPDAIETLRRCIRDANLSERIEVCGMRTKYPQGGERNLIPAITGRAVPVGGFPPDIGVAIFNVGTALAIAQAVIHDKPLIERVLTLTGKGINQPGNLLTLIGTPLQFLVDQRGGVAHNAAMAILGGPMMGPTAPSLNYPVLKGMSGITVLTEDEVEVRKEYACIRCARCVDICPLKLSPAIIARFSQRQRPEDAVANHLHACVECGSCSFVCPSNIPLVQYIRSGKAQARKLQN